jgi:hypothetical protein
MGDMMKYADDNNVSEYITDQAENSSLQEVTNSIVESSARNKFQLHPSKCKEVVVSFKRNKPNPPPSVLMNHKLNELTNYRFLV